MNKQRIPTGSSSAFSLVELLIVIATLGISVLLLLPILPADHCVLRERALNVMCQVRLRNLGVATMLYAGDNDGSLPWVDTAGGVTGGASSVAAGNVRTSRSVYRLHCVDLSFPRQFGPRNGAGQDIFEATTKSRLSGALFVDDWDLYHRLGGEVHCGSAAKRMLPPDNWWLKIP